MFKRQLRHIPKGLRAKLGICSNIMGICVPYTSIPAILQYVIFYEATNILEGKEEMFMIEIFLS